MEKKEKKEKKGKEKKKTEPSWKSSATSHRRKPAILDSELSVL